MIIIQSRNKIINQDRQDQLEPARHLNILWPVWPSLSSHNIIRLLRDHQFSRRPPVFSSSSRGVSTDLAVLRRPWKLWPAPIRPASNSSLQVSLIRQTKFCIPSIWIIRLDHFSSVQCIFALWPSVAIIIVNSFVIPLKSQFCIN